MFPLRKNSIYQWQPEKGTCCLLKGQTKACLGVNLNSDTCVNELIATSVCISCCNRVLKGSLRFDDGRKAFAFVSKFAKFESLTLPLRHIPNDMNNACLLN